MTHKSRRVYCIVPQDLGDELHEPLRRHFAKTRRGVQVIIDRRSPRNGPHVGADRRAVREEPWVARSLPPVAQEHARRLSFVIRREPVGVDAEERDSEGLVSLIQSGQVDHFGEFYIRYFDRVYGVVKGLVVDAHEAEEVTQAVFAKALAALPRFHVHDGGSVQGWLVRVARNTALDHIARRARLESVDPIRFALLEDPQADPSTRHLRPGDSGTRGQWIDDVTLERRFARLPLQQRQVLTLTYVYDLPTAEVAEVLDITPGNARVELSRARARLRRSPVERSDRSSMRRRARASTVLQRRRFALTG